MALTYDTKTAGYDRNEIQPFFLRQRVSSDSHWLEYRDETRPLLDPQTSPARDKTAGGGRRGDGYGLQASPTSGAPLCGAVLHFHVPNSNAQAEILQQIQVLDLCGGHPMLSFRARQLPELPNQFNDRRSSVCATLENVHHIGAPQR